MKISYLINSFGYGFRNTILKQKYSFKNFLQDCSSAIIISVNYIPLAITIALASGVPIFYGINTAIMGSLITSVFGSSIHNILGPTGGLIVIIAPIVEKYGIDGLLLAQFFASIMLIIYACFNKGFIVKLISRPMITAATTVIGLNLFITSLQELLVVKKLILLLHTNIFLHICNNIYSIFCCISMIMLIFIMNKLKFKYSPFLFAIAVCSIITYYINIDTIKIKTLGSVYSEDILTIADLSWYDRLLQMKNNYDTITGFFKNSDITYIANILFSAFTIAFMVFLQILFTASISNIYFKTKAMRFVEAIELAFANIIICIISGIPCSGALSRATMSIKTGSRSIFTPLLIGIILIVIFHWATNIINYIPIAAINTTLLLTAISMINIKKIKDIYQNGDYFDKSIFSICFIFGLIFNIVAAVIGAVIIRYFYHLYRYKTFNKHNLLSYRLQYHKNKKTFSIKFIGVISSLSYEDELKYIDMKDVIGKTIIVDFTKSVIATVLILEDINNQLRYFKNSDIIVICSNNNWHNIHKYVHAENIKILNQDTK